MIGSHESHGEHLVIHIKQPLSVTQQQIFHLVTLMWNVLLTTLVVDSKLWIPSPVLNPLLF